MNNLIIKLFVKNSEDIKNPRVRADYGRLAGIAGIASNVFLFIIKFLAGAITGSIAVIADAVNNLSDAGSSVVTLIGFKLSGKPADAKHPYGHERIEYIAGMIVSFLVTIAGFELFKSAISEIKEPGETEFGILSFIILGVSIIVKLWQGGFNTKIGKKIDSAALAATAADSIGDVVSTSVVLVGALVSYFANIAIDGWLALAVSLFIMYSGIRLIFETADPLLGVAPDDETVDKISRKILSYEGIIGIHDLVIHNYGPSRSFASVHAEVAAERDILESHDVIDNIEHDFLRDMGIMLVIHLDPVVTSDERVTELNRTVVGIARAVSPDLSVHDLRVVFGVTHHNVIFDVAMPIDMKLSETEVAERIKAALSAVRPDCNAVITVDRNYVSYVAGKED